MPNLIKNAPSRAYQFSAGQDSLSVEGNRFKMRVYKTGQRVEHWYWGAFVFETSSMHKEKKVIAALVDHETDKGCGIIDTMEIVDGFVEFSGEFTENENATYVKSMRGVMECSLRFNDEKTKTEFVMEGATVVVDGVTHEGPVYVFRGAPIRESSFTIFGAVPNTETDFKDKTPASNQKKEIPMADAPSPAELKASAQSELASKLASMKRMSSDVVFVADCFAQGMSLEQFSESLLTKQATDIAALSADKATLTAEVTALKAEVATLKAAPSGSQFSEGGTPPKSSEGSDKKVSFIDRVKAYQLANKCSYAEALTSTQRAEPEAFKAHMDWCRSNAKNPVVRH